MKPHFNYTGYGSYDLTECKVHCLTDPDGTRRIVVFVPKAWTAGEKKEMPTASGKTVSMRQFLITEWEEIEILRIPPSK